MTAPTRAALLDARNFVRAAEAEAKARHKKWTTALRRQIRAIALDQTKTLPERLTEAAKLVNAAPDIEHIGIEKMLDAMMQAAAMFGLEPTLALRADLRAIIHNKPPPKVAHDRTVEAFQKHQALQTFATMKAGEARH